MDTISDRIKQGMEIRNMKQVDILERTDINKGALSSYISGKYEPKQNNIYKLAKALNVNEAWLMGHDVPMERHDPEAEDLRIDSYYDTASEMINMFDEAGFNYEVIEKFDQLALSKGDFTGIYPYSNLVSEYIRLKENATIIESLLKFDLNSNHKIIESYEKLSDDGKTFISKSINNLLYYESKNQEVTEDQELYTTHPIYLLPASAGTGQFLDGENFEMVTFPTKEIPKGSNFGVRVSGNSMEPQLHDGDVAFIQRSKEIKSGNIGVFILNGEAYIKKMVCDMDKCFLVSLNPSYDPIEIKEGDNLRTVGKVLWVE